MIRFLLADDHAIIRAGLKNILQDGFPAVSFFEAGNATEVLGVLEKHTVDVIILDLSMPGRSGIDLLKDILAVNKKIPVLILSMHPEDQYAVRMLRAGASGYMTKDSAPNELVGAVQNIMNGRKYISSELSEKMLEILQDPRNTQLHEQLSDREFQVLVAIASGKTVSEIALSLSLSVKTVSTYRNRILEKMQMANNAELTHYAVKNHLV